MKADHCNNEKQPQRMKVVRPAIRRPAIVFVGRTENAGDGLFATCKLARGQVVGAYDGPKIPLEELRPGCEYALEMPGADVFIDGRFEHSQEDAPGERSLGTWCNHARRPNAEYQLQPASADEAGGQQQMWVVTTEEIAAGGEIRVSYEATGRAQDYWQGKEPLEDAWRQLRIDPPRSSRRL